MTESIILLVEEIAEKKDVKTVQRIEKILSLLKDCDIRTLDIVHKTIMAMRKYKNT